MVVFEKREDPIRLMKRRLLVALLLILLAVAVRGLWGVYQKEQESRKLREEAEAQLQNLKKRESGLRESISQLKSDRGVEAVLREEYELARDGEGLIVIVEPNPPPSAPEPTPFQRFRSWFSW